MRSANNFSIALIIFFLSATAGLFFLSKKVEINNGPVREATSTQRANSMQATSVTAAELKSTSSQENIAKSAIGVQSLLEIQRYIKANSELRAGPLNRADNAKGLYMTQPVANNQDSQLHKNIEKIIAETEINAVIIDVKEANGPYLPDSLKNVIEKFHQQGIWVIARICAFRDSSLMAKSPGLYIKNEVATSTLDGFATTTVTEIWKDSGGGYWLDPASLEAQNYIIEFSKNAIDFGFDELQFDYIRFPSDGDLKNIVYPFYDANEGKYEVIKEFFLDLSGTLRQYKPQIILSADIFGYVASLKKAPEIGQRLEDVSDLFDYVSFMLYPSHFYNGFVAPADIERNLPAVNFPYNSATPSEAVANHPYEVVLRSILSASDFLRSINSNTKIRPWLQDFNLQHDINMGIYYNADRVRAEITAAEDAGAFGWMLWSSSNVYTKEALLPE